MVRKYLTEDEVGRFKSAREARKNIRENKDFDRNERLKDIKAERALIKSERKIRKDNIQELTAFEDQGTRDIKNAGIKIPTVDNRGIHNMTVFNPWSAPERDDVRLGYNGFTLGETGRTPGGESVLDIIKTQPRRGIWTNE